MKLNDFYHCSILSDKIPSIINFKKDTIYAIFF